MIEYEDSGFKLKAISRIPPPEDDFGVGIDGPTAWEHFGGLNLEEAYLRFCDNPEIYQEDFMFMTSQAFIYYFPVIEKYLREVIPAYDFDDCEAMILAEVCLTQLKTKERKPDLFFERMETLCDLVLDRFGKLNLSDEAKEGILRKWSKVRKVLTSRAIQFR